MLPLERLAWELRSDGSTTSALDILAPRADAVHVGIRDALVSTRRMLTPRESALLAGVAVFRGPFTFDAAFVVSGAPQGVVLDDLGTLIELRLVEPLLDDAAE